MELMPREPDGREQENTTPQRPGAPARSAVRPDAGEPRAIQEQVPGAEPLPPRSSAARIERIRRRKRMRRIRAAAVCAVLLAAVLAYFTGIYGASLALLGDAVDSIGIALTPSPGYPVSFTLSGYQNALPLAGGFVAVGDKDLAIYSAGGNEVRRIQHGYGRPAITAGNTRVCVYNRAGKELRVESRSRTLFENKFDDAIQLCAMSPNGTLAVFTKSKLYVYDPMFENIYTFQTQDLPTALAFAGDNRQFAAGCPYAEGGALGGTVYLMDTRKDEYVYQFVRLIIEDHSPDKDVAYFAQKLGISPKRLTNLIRSISGQSAREWIVYYTILEIKSLLRESSLDIKSIAARVNFPDQTTLSRYFRHYTGVTPSQYRKNIYF